MNVNNAAAMDKSLAASCFRLPRFTRVLARLFAVISRSTLPLYLSAPWVPRLVGGVLLVAAALKAQQLFSDAARIESGVFQSRWFQVVLVEAELACGLALWLGLRPRFTRWAAMLLFAAFFGVALSQALSGARSCACFGVVQFHPWLAVLLDAATLGALSCWRPSGSEPPSCQDSVSTPERSILCRTLKGLLLLGLGVALPGALAFSIELKPRPLLEVAAARADLGTISAGGQAKARMRLHNPHAFAVDIVTVETSCPCLEVKLPERTVVATQRLAGEAGDRFFEDRVTEGRYYPPQACRRRTRGYPTRRSQ